MIQSQSQLTNARVYAICKRHGLKSLYGTGQFAGTPLSNDKDIHERVILVALVTSWKMGRDLASWVLGGPRVS